MHSISDLPYLRRTLKECLYLLLISEELSHPLFLRIHILYVRLFPSVLFPFFSLPFGNVIPASLSGAFLRLISFCSGFIFISFSLDALSFCFKMFASLKSILSSHSLICSVYSYDCFIDRVDNYSSIAIHPFVRQQTLLIFCYGRYRIRSCT